MSSYYTSKLLALLLLCCLGAGKSFAQGVGVNTDNSTADPSAILDIKSTDKGLLIPRVALTNTTTASPVTSPATSLMVYNTATAGDVTPGFYFWNGTAWTRVQTGTSSSGWGLTGNTGTTEGTNFIGNTDDKALEFRVNGIRAGRISNAFTDFNTSLGYGSLPAASTGFGNVALGYVALAFNTTGSENVANGLSALANNTTGSENVANGSSALLYNTTGSLNIAIGKNAMYSNVAGNNGVAIGRNAMYYANNTTTAFDNTNIAIGFEALRGSLSASANTGTVNSVLGYQAMRNNTTGSNNTANGAYALFFNTIGNSNVATGASALFSNTTGNNNTANGFQALVNNTTGSNNIANGFNALFANTTGSNNVALGYNTLSSGATHSGVTAVGANINIATPRTNVTALGSGIVNTDVPADNMVRIGNNSVTRTDLAGQLRVNAEGIGITDFTFPTTRGTNGQVLTSNGTGGVTWGNASSGWGLTGNTGTTEGTDFIGNTDDKALEFRVNGIRAGNISNSSTGNNTSLGYGSLPATSTGLSNTALGHRALRINTTGASNTAIGAFALYSNTIGSANVANGTDALFSNTVGQSNVAYGTSALSSNSTGSYNTAIGNGAGSGITTGSNNIAIGNYAQVPSGIADNQISIGNLIYATGIGAGGAGNVIIGATTTPRAKLEVSGFVNTNVGSYGFLSTGGAGTGGGGAQNFSIIASQRMAATEFNAYSDARIKHITGRSNTAQDLATLAQLQITNYTHIDHVNKGSREIKKVIAQEVKQVYPQAVSYLTDVVPNIYKIASMNAEGVVSVENDLKVGEKVKIIFDEEGAQLLEVQEANATSFKVASTKAGKVFVYGREVADFHVVDYEALSTLNISATQELLKRIQTLEAENNTLKAQVSDLNNLKAEVQKIKEALQIEASEKK